MCTASPVRADRLGEIVLKLKKKKLIKKQKDQKKKPTRKAEMAENLGTVVFTV